MIPQQPLPPQVPFSIKPPVNAEINLAVCQGIGDIIWVYQKFAPYFDRIRFKVLSCDSSETSRRALPWLELLPKFAGAQFWVDHPNRYRHLAAKACTMADAWKCWKMKAPEIDYSCNRWLEGGVRLDEIDHCSQVLETVNLRSEPFELPHDRYIVLYVSGDSRHDWLKKSPNHRLWGIAQWVEYLTLLRARYDLNLPVVIIGAAFDAEIAGMLAAAFAAGGFECSTMLGESPGRVVHLLKHAELFVGYQSGLSIVADQLDTPQVMIYFPYLAAGGMSYAWCKRKNIRTKFFADSFASTPAQVCEAHSLFTETSAALVA